MPSSVNGRPDPGRPPRKISLGGWEFNRYCLSPDHFPSVERYVLVGEKGSKAFADLLHDGSWRARLHPAIGSPNRRMFHPDDAFASATDALAAVVNEMLDRDYGVLGDDF